MNEDHQLSLYAMVQSTLSRKEKLTLVSVKNCKLTSVNLNEARISYLACGKNLCAQKDAVLPFDPPMLSLSDCRPRFVAMHQQCLQPNFSWLLTEPLSRTCLFLMAGLGYAYYCVDMQALAEQNETVAAIAGEKGEVFAYAVKISWIFGISAHILEAIYAAFVCKTVLKMKNMAALSWFLIISMVGYPMTTKVLEFVSIQKKSNKGKHK